MTPAIEYWLVLSAALFALGVFGVFFNRRSLILVLMSLELAFLGANVNFIAFAARTGDLAGQAFALFALAVAAAEAAIGLGILVAFFRLRGEISAEAATDLKG